MTGLEIQMPIYMWKRSILYGPNCMTFICLILICYLYDLEYLILWQLILFIYLYINYMQWYLDSWTNSSYDSAKDGLCACEGKMATVVFISWYRHCKQEQNSVKCFCLWPHCQNKSIREWRHYCIYIYVCPDLPQ